MRKMAVKNNLSKVSISNILNLAFQRYFRQETHRHSTVGKNLIFFQEEYF
jgi:hypothetical protein